VLLAAVRSSDARATIASTEGPRVRSSGLSIATVWRSPPPPVQMLKRPLWYPETRRTARRGRQTEVAFHQSYQSAGSPNIEYLYPLFALSVQRTHPESNQPSCSEK